MLHDAGIVRSECYITNVCKYRPPGNDIEAFMWERKGAPPNGFTRVYGKYVDKYVVEGLQELEQDIETLKPDLIIPLGNIALWAISRGEIYSVSSWRGSQLYTQSGIRYVPTYHPAAVLRQWSWRAIAVADLRRAVTWAREKTPDPDYRFIVRPEFNTVVSMLEDLIARANTESFRLACDIETRLGLTACVGIAWSDRDALCIPLMCVERDDGYWDEEQEFIITRLMLRLLMHKNVRVVGQNFIYDAQYFQRAYNWPPHTVDDTMVMQHVAFAGMPKGLDFLSSLYCRFHRYWKEEGKLWDPKTTDEEQLWVYNCKDAVVTYEVAEVLEATLEKLNLTQQYRERMKQWWAVFIMTLRGVSTDKAARGMLSRELIEANMELEQRLTYIIGHPINVKSPKQLKDFFYGELNLAPIIDRKSGRVSTNFEALQKLAAKEPLIWPIVDILLTQRSIGVFVSTFLSSQLDVDGRMRCSFNIAGPETYRLSSSQNPFGSGMNLQNIPSGDRKKLLVKMPNVRKTFIPDPGKIIFDIDLDRADLQVVVWEADDADLKRQLRLGVDLHIMNGMLLAGKSPPPEDELVESHPNYEEHKARYKKERQLAKNFVHGTNYGGKERTMAAVCGIIVADCARLQKRWFDLHPGIKRWHERTEQQLMTKRYVTNAFGYRRYYFDRIENCLTEALAWVPQSTVAIVTAKMQDNIEFNLPEVNLLIQVHDSLVGQYHPASEAYVLPRLRKECTIVIPYPDPLIIPVGLKTSTKSWGDCKEKSWPTDALLTG